MLRTIIALQDNVTEMVFYPKFSKLLNDANLMLDQIRVFKPRSFHGACKFTRGLLPLEKSNNGAQNCGSSANSA
jgi:hypothetical protein